MKNEIHPIQVIVYEGAGSEPWAVNDRLGVTTCLLDEGYSVLRITESADDHAFSELTTDAPVIVLGQFTGATPEVESSDVSVVTHDTTGLDSEAIVSLVRESRDETGAELNQPGRDGAWKPWFPVIDYDRCTNCMQCLSFCLFDVYGVSDDNTIQVQNNDNCKTNCPACSRVCPEVAIMFPKYKAGPINGEPVSDADVQREKMKVDISALLGGDIYSRLRQRSEEAKNRFSSERDSDKALAERKRCLTKLAADGDIPAEVLANLPSPEEIKRKAEQAAAKASEALARNA